MWLEEYHTEPWSLLQLSFTLPTKTPTLWVYGVTEEFPLAERTVAGGFGGRREKCLAYQRWQEVA